MARGRSFSSLVSDWDQNTAPRPSWVRAIAELRPASGWAGAGFVLLPSVSLESLPRASSAANG